MCIKKVSKKYSGEGLYMCGKSAQSHANMLAC